MNPPQLAQIFRIGTWQVISGMVQNTDTVFDVNKKWHRIKQARGKREKGQGVRLSINMNGLVFNQTNKVITIDENKRRDISSRALIREEKHLQY